MHGAVARAGMDGSNNAIIVTGLVQPAGIVLDSASSRLYWADRMAQKIQSSNLDGDDVITIATLAGQPYGIAIVQNRLYWSIECVHVIQRSETDGRGIISMYNGTSDIRHFTAPDLNVPSNRTNPCREENCSGVCVLTPTSYACL